LKLSTLSIITLLARISEWSLKFNFFGIFPFQVSGELSAASPERLSMASPGGRGKRVHNLQYSSDMNQSRISSHHPPP